MRMPLLRLWMATPCSLGIITGQPRTIHNTRSSADSVKWFIASQAKSIWQSDGSFVRPTANCHLCRYCRLGETARQRLPKETIMLLSGLYKVVCHFRAGLSKPARTRTIIYHAAIITNPVEE
ncbi:hypothetical protein PILCRDRAFT_372642 [Piloderma croceum F 1598]|uniref:Secreted protein n=1 Tax=Piloderma croceum (strain F 1598) TaxID=765440 RepID=A0A0C3FLF5_PILCF|nr:hypothetical protein PILCRDRAFT_372642 [Piloderma croceum F 1598]